MRADDVIRSDFVDEILKTAAMLSGSQDPLPATCPPTQTLEGIVPGLDAALKLATSTAYDRAETMLKEHLAQTPSSPLVGSISPFRAMGFRRDELAHTKAIAWLLDPTQRHGFGSMLFAALGRAIECDSPDLKCVKSRIFGGGTRLSRVESELWLTRSCRADVFVEGYTSEGLVLNVVIEAKILACEGKDQLPKLLAATKAPNKLGVFLSPSGDAGKGGEDAWARLSYISWARELLRLLPGVRGLPGAAFLQMYVTGLLEDVCGMRLSGDPQAVVSANSPFQLEWLLEEPKR